jgi:GT2 family glycosyltransferase
MAQEKVDLSIIIVSTNIEKMLRECLKSVYGALKGIRSEVIVVDNASTDNTPNMVSDEFPKVKMIRKHENHGFAENNNYGMKVAKGRYILLLNSDTKIIDKNIFKEMISWMDSHPKAGLVSCALLNSDGKTYQGSGGFYPTLPRVLAWMSFLDDVPVIDKLIKPYHPLHGWSPFYKGNAFFRKPHRQDWVTGAFFLLRKEVVEEVGYFDEDFFLYTEEVELSHRIAKAGWEIWYLPQWQIIHFGQVTTGSEKATIFELQNLVLLYKKHEPKWKIPVLKVLLRFGVALRIILWTIAGERDVTKIYAKAFKVI